ncbi:hypothetical protein ERO13_A09G081700v2 [Gossypium hirsutum]|uniref:Uncharacterized protein isoform X1 n=1 Tax=Gossypium hirsutum TaxID=3635 RepID=A0A1U8HYA0_GOSHI|nr:uncharacterized protein LOC107889113 isoform X1 [Gossypium hirsutum]KAG4183003.1 hypothetical protein ERO13_A09G081700v2 [Gossypium hirsutum]
MLPIPLLGFRPCFREPHRRVIGASAPSPLTQIHEANTGSADVEVYGEGHLWGGYGAHEQQLRGLEFPADLICSGHLGQCALGPWNWVCFRFLATGLGLGLRLGLL